MTRLAVADLTVRRGDRTVVADVSFEVREGEVVGLIGPNGAGKTTLMRALLGLLPHEGRSSLTDLSPRDRAKAAAWMPQTREVAWPVSVETLVALGRTPHLAGGRRLSTDDRRAIAEAMSVMDLGPFRTRPATELSGGELARVLIARVLAQDTPLILADEPVAGLDPASQIALMKVFRRIAGAGKAVVVSMHDLSLAARHCSRLLLMHKGRLVADGPPDAVLDDARCREVFGIGAHWHDAPDGRAFHMTEGAI